MTVYTERDYAEFAPREEPLKIPADVLRRGTWLEFRDVSDTNGIALREIFIPLGIIDIHWLPHNPRNFRQHAQITACQGYTSIVYNVNGHKTEPYLVFPGQTQPIFYVDLIAAKLNVHRGTAISISKTDIPIGIRMETDVGARFTIATGTGNRSLECKDFSSWRKNNRSYPHASVRFKDAKDEEVHLPLNETLVWIKQERNMFGAQYLGPA